MRNGLGRRTMLAGGAGLGAAALIRPRRARAAAKTMTVVLESEVTILDPHVITATITRTREQACLRAEEALTKLKEGMLFADVVAAYSDESGAATREGSIGTIERTDVAPPFADAAFELKMKEVSEVVESHATALGIDLAVCGISANHLRNFDVE